MKRALISPLENNRIAQIEAQDFPVAPPFHWVDVPDDTTTLDKWDGTKVVKYVAPIIPPPDPIVTQSQLQAFAQAAGLSQTAVAVGIAAVNSTIP